MRRGGPSISFSPLKNGRKTAREEKRERREKRNTIIF
jgi:hypothetical protein